MDESAGGTYLEPDGTVARAAIIRAVRDEMALKLSDIVFRRSSLGTRPRISRISVEDICRVAGAELGWDARRQEAEVEDVMRQIGSGGSVVEAVG